MEDPEKVRKAKGQDGGFCASNRCIGLVLVILIAAIGAVALVTFLAPGIRHTVVDEREPMPWWKTSIIYQIYPRSFQDTNGDGLGDLNGIISRLYYLNEINVGAIWISPFYKSPMKDFGYDVSNYTQVDPIFGNMTDFERLVKEAHEKGIKVIVDFVPNHTSDQCTWFQRSKTGSDERYKDYYVWMSPENITNRQPPNSWEPNNPTYVCPEFGYLYRNVMSASQGTMVTPSNLRLLLQNEQNVKVGEGASYKQEKTVNNGTRLFLLAGSAFAYFYVLLILQKQVEIGGRDGEKPYLLLPSIFGGSAWTWDEGRQQYYYHAFLPSQPDLNYSNPFVLQEIDDVITFWLDKGVDGFRLDAIPFLFESSNTSLVGTKQDRFIYSARDIGGIGGMTPSPSIRVTFPKGQDSGRVFSEPFTYMRYQEGTLDVVRRWKSLISDYEGRTGKTIVLIAEATEITVEQRDKYFEAGTVPFFFDLLNAKKTCGATSACYTRIIRDSVNLSEGQWPTFVTGNHDNNRIADVNGPEYIDAMNMMLLTLPGTPTTYYGEELGMRDGNYTGMRPKDTSAITLGDWEKSRDPERNPMQWDDTLNAGFTNVTPWLPITRNTDYQHINVKTELESASSHLGIYKRLAALRQKPAFQNAKIEFPSVATSGDVLSYMRGDRTSLSSLYLILINLSRHPQPVRLDQPSYKGQLVISTNPTTTTIDLSYINLSIGEGLVIELERR